MAGLLIFDAAFKNKDGSYGYPNNEHKYNKADFFSRLLSHAKTRSCPWEFLLNTTICCVNERHQLSQKAALDKLQSKFDSTNKESKPYFFGKIQEAQNNQPSAFIECFSLIAEEEIIASRFKEKVAIQKTQFEEIEKANDDVTKRKLVVRSDGIDYEAISLRVLTESIIQQAHLLAGIEYRSDNLSESPTSSPRIAAMDTTVTAINIATERFLKDFGYPMDNLSVPPACAKPDFLDLNATSHPLPATEETVHMEEKEDEIPSTFMDFVISTGKAGIIPLVPLVAYGLMSRQ